MKTYILRRASLLLLVLGLAATVRAQTAPVQFYLKLDDVKGGSTAANFPNQIVGTGFTFSVTNAGARQGKASGGSAGFPPIVFSKYVDIASPALALGAATGTSYQQATISFVQTVQGTPMVTYSIVLKTVIVAGVVQTARSDATTDNPNANPTEAVSLSYGTIQWQVGSTKAGYDLQTAAKLEVTTNSPPHDIQARLAEKTLAVSLPALPLK